MEDQEKFIRERKDEFEAMLKKDAVRALEQRTPLSEEALHESIERIATKVFEWDAQGREGKRILLEASESAAYKTVRPLLGRLMQDERCGGFTLLADNVAGAKFEEEREDLSLRLVRKDGPVLADIEGSFDAILVLKEPNNSADKTLLHAGKSVFGKDGAKLVYLLDGLIGHTTRATLESVPEGAIDVVCAADEFSKELLAAAVPKLSGRIRIIGSPMLEAFKEDLERQHLYEPEDAERARRATREVFHVPLDATLVLYSGFPSLDFAAFTQPRTDGKTLNQATFEKTLAGIIEAAKQAPDTQFALAVRMHPRAGAADNTVVIPESLPPNLTVVRTEESAVNYDAIAGAADIVACQSTSTEVFFAPYRGVVTAVSGYDEQDVINRQIFGSGLTAFKTAEGVTYLESPTMLVDLLLAPALHPKRRPIPADPSTRLVDELLG